MLLSGLERSDEKNEQTKNRPQLVGCDRVSGAIERACLISTSNYRTRRAIICHAVPSQNRSPRTRAVPPLAGAVRTSVAANLITCTTVCPEMVLSAESAARLRSKLFAVRLATVPDTPCCCSLILSGDAAACRRYSYVAFNLDALALGDGGWSEGERVRNAATEAVAAVHPELAEH